MEITVVSLKCVSTTCRAIVDARRSPSRFERLPLGRWRRSICLYPLAAHREELVGRRCVEVRRCLVQHQNLQGYRVPYLI